VDLPYKQLREDTLHDLKLMNGSKSSWPCLSFPGITAYMTESVFLFLLNDRQIKAKLLFLSTKICRNLACDSYANLIPVFFMLLQS
jgi:hypothetical protein